MRISFHSILLTIFAFSSPTLLGADPSAKDNFEPLKQHGTAPEANAIWAKAVEAEKSVRQHVEKFSKAKAIDPKQLTAALLEHDDLRVLDGRLAALGEATSIDFETRRRFYEERLVAAYNAWLGQPNSPPIRQKAIKELSNSQAKRMQKYEAIATQLANGDDVGAEKAVDSMADELYRLANLLSIEERKDFVTPFETVRGRVESVMRVNRTKAAAQAFEEKIGLFNEEIKSSFQRLDAAIASLEQSGSAQVEDKTLSGPELLNDLMQQWNKGHIRIQISAALQRIQDRSASTDSYSIGSPSNSNDKWSANAEELATAFKDRVKKLIAAETKSVHADKAKEHYFAMLQSLANIDARLNDDDWTSSTQKSLKELARKAGMGQDAENYDLATSEWLHWKELVARAQSQGLKTHAGITTLARDKLTIGPQNRIGMYSTAQDEPGRPRQLSAIPDLAPLVGKTFDNAKVLVKNVRPLDGSKPVWMSQVEAGLYCMISGDTSLPEQVERLGKGLLADDANPSLSLRATTAMWSAKKGYYEVCACSTQDCVIEAATSRYATFPESASQIIPYGEVHPQGVQGELNFLLIRFVAKPEWVQHRYFVSQLK